jgi:chromosome segregation ATPase
MSQVPETRDALLAAARAAHRDAERERARARKLAARLARRLQHTLDTARARLDAERAEFEVRVTKFNAVQSRFNAESAEVAQRQTGAWADIAARQKRLDAEHEEANRYHTEQAAALDARAAELEAREKQSDDVKRKLQREVAALRDEVNALDARAQNARAVVEELERQRSELRATALAPAASGPAGELLVALDRAADRDLGRLAVELGERERNLAAERAAVQKLCDGLTADHATLADRRRVLAEQFAQLAAARNQWQAAERATLAEMEDLARSLRRREAELDARAARLSRADARRREDAYDLWQMRLRLEGWQSKLVAYEMRWHTEREHAEADLARRAEAVLRREAQLPADAGAVPTALPVPDDGPAVPAELAALREELERMATVLMEAELPEPPDAPESELPWGAEAAPDEPAGAAVLPFEPARAA